jgi:hypothetical protein
MPQNLDEVRGRELHSDSIPAEAVWYRNATKTFSDAVIRAYYIGPSGSRRIKTDEEFERTAPAVLAKVDEAALEVNAALSALVEAGLVVSPECCRYFADMADCALGYRQLAMKDLADKCLELSRVVHNHLDDEE